MATKDTKSQSNVGEFIKNFKEAMKYASTVINDAAKNEQIKLNNKAGSMVVEGSRKEDARNTSNPIVDLVSKDFLNRSYNAANTASQLTDGTVIDPKDFFQNLADIEGKGGVAELDDDGKIRTYYPSGSTSMTKEEVDKARKATTEAILGSDNSQDNPDDYIEYTYKPGDTFGQVILDLGLDTNKGLWGSDGDVAYYTQQLRNQGIPGMVPIGTKIRLKRRK